MKKILLLSVLLVASCSDDDYQEPETTCRTFEFRGVPYTFAVQSEEHYQDIIVAYRSHHTWEIFERANPCE